MWPRSLISNSPGMSLLEGCEGFRSQHRRVPFRSCASLQDQRGQRVLRQQVFGVLVVRRVPDARHIPLAEIADHALLKGQRLPEQVPAVESSEGLAAVIRAELVCQ